MALASRWAALPLPGLEQGAWRQALHVSCDQHGVGMMGLGAAGAAGAAGAFLQLALPLCKSLCPGLGKEKVSEQHPLPSPTAS